MNAKMQEQISNSLSILNCCLYRDRSFINIVTSPSKINLLFFNIVPQLIKKTCRAGTACFIDLRAREERRHIFL